MAKKSAKNAGGVAVANPVAKVLKEMGAHAEKIRNDDDQDVSMLLANEHDTFAQGDVYITKLNALPKEIEEITPVAKLAPGETQGSRHELAHLDGVRMYRRKTMQECDGPLLQFTKPNDITHPEHGNVVNIPPGFYAITYQQTGDQIRRRVRD